MILKKIFKLTFLPTIIVVIILFSTLTIMILNTKTYLAQKNRSTSSTYKKIINSNTPISSLKIANSNNTSITSTTSSNTISNVYNPENTYSRSHLQTNTNLNQSSSNLQSGPNYNNPSISSQIY